MFKNDEQMKIFKDTVVVYFKITSQYAPENMINYTKTLVITVGNPA
jgi:hypothetical protein